MNIKLETERLFLREFTIDDAGLLYDMHLDPEISRYTGDPFPWDSIAHAQQILTDIIIPQYKLNIGRWAVYMKESGIFLGWCGIKLVDGEYDLGYRFIQKYWGHGFATESATAVLHYGTKLNLNPIIGRVSVNNSASINVLNKCGLTFEKRYSDKECGESVRFRYVYP
jgi:RimJ/RimL family protein N-acetyltransferase